MTIEFLSILALIAILSVVQSFFGMGILVFGTPTLLLAGYDFITALSYLLPASFAISLLQVFGARKPRPVISKYLYILCLPMIGIGLWLVERSPLGSWTNLLVGSTLLATAVFRFWPKSQYVLQIMLEKHLPAYHIVMGLVHGVTNLGGALLAILAGGTNSDKDAIRYTVAHYYLAFSAVQMTMLAAVMGHVGDLIGNVYMMGVSAAVYLLVGNRIFIRSSNQIYNTALTAFIAAYGLAVLIRY